MATLRDSWRNKVSNSPPCRRRRLARMPRRRLFRTLPRERESPSHPVDERLHAARDDRLGQLLGEFAQRRRQMGEAPLLLPSEAVVHGVEIGDGHPRHGAREELQNGGPVAAPAD